MPESKSAHVNVTVAEPADGSVTIPRASGAGTTEAVIVGGVLSILTVVVTVAEFPARSVAAPDAVCPAPSAVKDARGLHAATPESASAHAKLTVTLVLFQPKLLAGGTRFPLIVGGVRSMFSVTEVVETFPAESTTLPLTTCPEPSAVTVTGAAQLETPEVASLH